MFDEADVELTNPDADPAPPEQTPVPGGRNYRWRRPPDALTTWWWSLPDETRSSLAALRPGDPLCPAAAEAVDVVGIPCPRVTTVVGGRRVAHLVATPPLIRTVQLVRMTHSERRLV